MPADISVENHGSIFLFRPLSQWWGLALAVEHRYANEVAVCALDAGLHVS
jgi:hypothetical protein